jgi:hypothetical protein
MPSYDISALAAPRPPLRQTGDSIVPSMTRMILWCSGRSGLSGCTAPLPRALVTGAGHGGHAAALVAYVAFVAVLFPCGHRACGQAERQRGPSRSRRVYSSGFLSRPHCDKSDISDQSLMPRPPLGRVYGKWPSRRETACREPKDPKGPRGSLTTSHAMAAQRQFRGTPTERLVNRLTQFRSIPTRYET